jgi:hypothetical protein
MDSSGGNDMKKLLLFVLVMLLSITVFGCTSYKAVSQVKVDGQGQEVTQIKEVNQIIEDKQQLDETDKNIITGVVEDFGKKLQMVSLLAPKDMVNKSMQENYGGLVSPALLAKWQSDPQNAPGRMVSSPWPDRIDILGIEKSSEDTYEVKGEIVEITSMEKENGGFAAKRPITLVLKNVDNRWLIDAVTLGAYEGTGSIVYENIQYGFSFSLPASWKGYTIITDKWDGLASNEQKGVKTVETGPVINIRHPEWTSQNPRQDIPIMIFTLTQWNELQKEVFHIGAAPIGPSELGRNSGFVFALPARYNFAFPTGYEDVEKILGSNPLHAK